MRRTVPHITVRGFTLSELLVALAILGVIATFTIPKVLQSQQDASRYAKAQEILGTVSGVMEKYKFANSQCFPGNITCSFNASTGAVLDGKDSASFATGATASYNSLVSYLDQNLNYTSKAVCPGCEYGGETCYQLHSGSVLCPVSIGLSNFYGKYDIGTSWVLFIDEPLSDVVAGQYSYGGVDADYAHVWAFRSGRAFGGWNTNRILQGIGYDSYQADVFDLKEHPEDTCANVGSNCDK